MSSVLGENFKVSIFGQSHGEAIGAVIDGFETGFPLDVEKLQGFLDTRAPGGSDATPRKEGDKVEFLAGLNPDGRLCGAPLAAIIRNTNTRSGDYANLLDVPRPGHADYTAQIKYGGAQDIRGGGHFSGRLTAPLCIAGGIARQILEAKGIKVYARIKQIGNVKDEAITPYPEEAELAKLDGERYPVYNRENEALMRAEIEAARMDLDSVGGIIECAVFGLPAGIGGPMFDGCEGVISKNIFGIPAVKGIEFGSGFIGSSLRGSQNNDPYFYDNDGNIKTATNNHGGILGGITSGMPLYFSVAIKPTPSIGKTQQSVSLSRKENTELNVKGRHDPCIVPRAVPCIIAATALSVYDMMLGC